MSAMHIFRALQRRFSRAELQLQRCGFGFGFVIGWVVGKEKVSVAAGWAG